MKYKSQVKHMENYIFKRNPGNVIASILNDPHLGIVGKILSLKEKSCLDHKFIADYLTSKNLNDLEDLFFNPSQLKKLIPLAHSSSGWTEKELLYYNVELIGKIFWF